MKHDEQNSPEQVIAVADVKQGVGWDRQVDPWLEHFGPLLDNVPNSYRIWLSARRYLAVGDVVRAKRCINLIKLLHDSYVPLEANFGEGVRFGYGGIGNIIHPDCEIGNFVTIASGVVLGGKRDRGRLHSSGRRVSVPKIESYAYISGGAKILGGLTVGAFAIIGANAVVTKDVPRFAVMAGVPAKQIDIVSEANISKYRSVYLPLRSLNDSEFSAIFKREMDRRD